MHVHRRHDRAMCLEEALHRVAERRGCEFHFPELVDHGHPPVAGSHSAGRVTRSNALRSTPYLPTRGGPRRFTCASTARWPSTAVTANPTRRKAVIRSTSHRGACPPWFENGAYVADLRVRMRQKSRLNPPEYRQSTGLASTCARGGYLRTAALEDSRRPLGRPKLRRSHRHRMGRNRQIK